MSDILPNSEAERGPAGTHRIGRLPDFHFLEGKVSIGHWHGHVELTTAITVTQGYSLVAMHIAQEDFRAVIDEMIAVDPEAVLAAFSAAQEAASLSEEER